MTLSKLTPAADQQHTGKPAKILLSAYACEPGRGSEPGVGWNMAREIAQYHQVWVFTSNTHRAQIEAELERNPLANLQFIYLDPWDWVYDWSQEGQRAQWDVHLHYYLWQIAAYFHARQVHQDVNFDLVHHVTYVKYSSPSFLSLLPIPFLWGPVGGGESTPKAFWQGLSSRAKVYEFLRSVARGLGELDPFVHLTARKSCISWATTADTAKCLSRIGAQQVRVLSQIGLNDEELHTLASHAANSQPAVRFISIGRLLHWKGFHLGLQAFAQANLPPSAEYWLVGSGPELETLQHLTQALGISDRVKFWNSLPRDETLQRLGGCLALVHPSLHDSGGMVCLEAMATGCPVICLDLGGPAVMVTQETGFKIPAHDPDQAISEMAMAMQQLAIDQDLRDRLGLAGQKRVHALFAWTQKGQDWFKIYRTVLSYESQPIEQ
jgi:glycosyltransferase involved in cell wall biosynthesis